MPGRCAATLISALLWGTLMLTGTARAAGLPPGVMALAGQPAPALELADLDGETYTLADSRGEWVFVHFWASWCGPCRLEMPTIARLRSLIPEERLRIVMVNTAETEDEVFGFMAAVASDLTALLDHNGRVTEVWQPRGLPATFLVDPEGRLRYLALGGREWDKEAYVEFLRDLIEGR